MAEEEEEETRERRTPIADTVITQSNLDRLLAIQKTRLAAGKGGTTGNPRADSVISRRIALIREGLADQGPPPTPTASSLGSGSLLDPFTGQFQPPDMGAAAQSALDILPDVPQFTGPQVPNIDPFSFRAYQPSDPFSFEGFQGPTAENVANAPGFRFRLDEGLKALQNSAAAKGLLRSGGTLKDFMKYGQGFASNEFQNVYNRQLNTWGANRRGAAEDYDRNVLNRRQDYMTDYGTAAGIHRMNVGNEFATFDRQFDFAGAEFAPKMAGYQTQAQAAQRGAELSYDRGFREYLTDWEIFERNQSKVFDRLFAQQELGVRAALG